MADSIWVGHDEHEGVRAQPRPDIGPPPGWRLEAIAHTPRPRSLTMGADRRSALFIEDGEWSDVWALDLETGVAEQVTTGRAPAPYWEDAAARLSPDATTVAYTDGGDVWLVPAAGGTPRRLVAGGSPVWIDDERLLVSVEHDHTTRLAVIGRDDPWPRRLAAATEPSEPAQRGAAAAEPSLAAPRDPRRAPGAGDEGDAVVSPDRTEVAYVFFPRDDLNRSDIRIASLASGEVRTVAGVPGMHAASPAWSPDGATLAYASEAAGFYELHLVGRDGAGERQLTHAGADHTEPEWHPDGARIVAVRGRRNRFDLVVVDAATGEARVIAEGGTWSSPHWTAAGDIAAGYESHATPPELRLVRADDPGPEGGGEASPEGGREASPEGGREARREGGREARRLRAPAPRAIRAARHARLEEVAFPSFDGREIPGFMLRPAGASPEQPVPAVVHPHGGPTDAAGDQWDGHAQYFVAKGYAWLAPNFRGSTGYGRDFERANHGVWGVEDTKDCLAAADHLRTLDWIDGDRLGIFGGSYGSYMALLAVTDDPEHRFRCAVAKYGDCDIFTSWAQGDRDGVLDLERMMGPPSQARAGYRAGSPFHRLANVQVPLLIAHGERDERVSPKQSEQLVAELRRLGGKTFEYVTYPSEGHGFLRAAPQIDFYTRLERFLDWHLV